MAKMDKTTDILTKIGRRDGMTVPEGYFADFVARMEASLPERPELQANEAVLPRSRWQRLRPYVYMAAMFGGIWCMLKMFTMLTSTAPVPMDRNPIVMEAFANDEFVNDYILDDVNQWDYYDELMDDGVDPQALCDSLIYTEL